MDISNSARVRKLASNLAAHPDLVLPYLRHSLLTRQRPIDKDMPWWSFAAIKRADELLPGKRVFEFGTGGSTLRYAKVAKSIVAVEDDAFWGEIVQRKLAAAGITNVDIRLCPFDFDQPQGFPESAYLRAFDPTVDYDVVVIDGQDKTFRERIACFRHVEPAVARTGGIIIVDDWWRYTELLDSNLAKRVEVCESVGPCRIGVTSTAFFFYA
jgi:predicted O-methyltransferase YrrM